MKKVLATLLVLCTVFTLVACGKTPQSLDLDVARAEVDKLGLMGLVLIPSDDELQNLYGIDAGLVEKGLFRMFGSITQASSYMVVLPKEGKESELKGQLDGYVDLLSRNFENYLPDQYALVKGYKHTSIKTKEGTYLVYIISSDNDAVLKAIESGLVYDA